MLSVLEDMASIRILITLNAHSEDDLFDLLQTTMQSHQGGVPYALLLNPRLIPEALLNAADFSRVIRRHQHPSALPKKAHQNINVLFLSFCIVTRYQTIKLASPELETDQSNVSQHISSLESIVGGELFARQGNLFVSTRLADRLLPTAYSYLGLLDELRGLVLRMQINENEVLDYAQYAALAMQTPRSEEQTKS